MAKQVDWEAIERDYSEGMLTLRQIADKYNNVVSHVAISNRAKDFGWSKDLRDRIRAKAQEKLNKRALNGSLTKPGFVNQDEIIECNAEVQADILSHHRKDGKQARGLAAKLLAEVERTGDCLDELNAISEIIETADSARAQQLFEKVTSIPQRIKSAKDGIDALARAIAIERQAFGIDDHHSVGQTLDSFLDSIANVTKQG